MERGWRAHVLGEAPERFTDPVDAVRRLRVRTRPPGCPARGPRPRGPARRRAAADGGSGAALPPADSAGAVQEPKAPGGKPVSDQWLEAFVIEDEAGQPVGPVQVRRRCSRRRADASGNPEAQGAELPMRMPARSCRDEHAG